MAGSRISDSVSCGPSGRGPFIPVTAGNEVILDFAALPGDSITMQHYAFLVSDSTFDAAYERIQQTGLTYYADPQLTRPR